MFIGNSQFVVNVVVFFRHRSLENMKNICNFLVGKPFDSVGKIAEIALGKLQVHFCYIGVCCKERIILKDDFACLFHPFRKGIRIFAQHLVDFIGIIAVVVC